MSVLTVEQARRIFETQTFDEYIGVAESTRIDFKEQPYRLDDEHGKLELSKDVSGLANSGGGLIIIGVKTKVTATQFGEVADQVRPFERSMMKVDQYRDVISRWVYPQILGLDVLWRCSEENADKGLGPILVPPDLKSLWPFLVRKTADGQKLTERLVGHFERTQTDTKPTTIERIHALIRMGLEFTEVREQYQNIQDTLQALVDSEQREARANAAKDQDKSSQALVDSQQKKARANAAEQQHRAFKSQRGEAIQAAGYEQQPNLLLAAYPTKAVIDVKGLFRAEADVVRLLIDPPRLREDGWDLKFGAGIQNIRGELRRRVAKQWKLLQLSRQGLLLFLAPGDERYLCWTMQSRADAGLTIRPLPLAEAVHSFVLLSQQVCEYVVPTPEEIRYVVELRNMATDGHLPRLHPLHDKENIHLSRHAYHSAPYASEGFDYTSARSTSAGVITFELLRKIYLWFGFLEDHVPYYQEDDGLRVIDAESLFPKQM